MFLFSSIVAVISSIETEREENKTTCYYGPEEGQDRSSRLLLSQGFGVSVSKTKCIKK